MLCFVCDLHFLQIAITAALGFDSYLVMRHGAGPFISIPANSDGSSGTSEDVNAFSAKINKLSTEDVDSDQRLGCYFCSDVVAPVDVISDIYPCLEEDCFALFSSDVLIDSIFDAINLALCSQFPTVHWTSNVQ